MANNIKIPAIPTREVRFEKGTLKFDILSGCAYIPDMDGFTGGDWVNAHIKTKEGEPVWIKLDAGELVVEKLTDYLVEQSTGNLIGGKIVEIARFNICE